MTKTKPKPEDDFARCEFCDWCGSIEDAVNCGDVDLCPKCYEQWKSESDRCEHVWTPGADQFGDPGKCCSKCCLFSPEDGDAA